MGILDDVFAGVGGISAELHRMLGGDAIVRVKTYIRDGETNSLIPSFQDFLVPFVPAEIHKERRSENAPDSHRSETRLSAEEITGTFPFYFVDVPIVAERDSIVVNNVEYTISTIDLLKVGSAAVQYSITAKRA